MGQAYKRKLLFKANRFQKPIINLIIFPAVPVYLIAFFYLTYFYYSVTNKAMMGIEIVDLELITRITVVILIVLWVFSLLMLLLVYRVSNQIVGAFERILKETDDILAGKPKHHIHARKEDILANEVLKRINKLIDKIP